MFLGCCDSSRSSGELPAATSEAASRRKQEINPGDLKQLNSLEFEPNWPGLREGLAATRIDRSILWKQKLSTESVKL